MTRTLNVSIILPFEFAKDRCQRGWPHPLLA
jgi:hypothetical protein